MSGAGAWPPRRPGAAAGLSRGDGIPAVTQWFRQPTAALEAGGQGPGESAARLDAEQFRRAVHDVQQAAVESAGDLDRGQVRELIEREVSQRERTGVAGYLFPVRWHDQLVQAVYDELYGLGPLQPFLEDPAVENIDINGCDRVFISYADGTRRVGPPVAVSDEELITKIQQWARGGNTAREFSMAAPLLNTALQDLDGVRLSAVMSVSPRPLVSIRRHRLVDVTLEDLVRNGTIDEGLRQFLQAAVRARKSIIISGGTNAGKTTLLRALTSAIDPAERIATLESDLELYLHWLTERHQDVIAFEARRPNSEGMGEITLHDLIPQALRHNPRRIIVGEARSTEIVPMLEAMQSGHEGSMGTLHANRAEDVFNRILILATRGGLAMPPQTIHLLVGMSIDLIVHMRRDGATGQRCVSQVLEVLPPGDTERPSTNEIYVPGADGRAIAATTPHCLPELVAAGFNPRYFDNRAPVTWGARS